MPKVLLDHATISSAFRALGFIEFEGRELLDVEQTALERVCEAVLLADQVVVPDNYKAEFRSERLSRLSIVPFQSIEVGKEIESKIDDVATSMSRVWHEAFTAGNERGTFNQMFKKVEGLASFIWAHSGSTFFLVFRALGAEKGSPFLDAFFASSVDYAAAKQFNIFDESDQPVAWEALSQHVRRMLAVLAWLGKRYVWYQVFAAQHDLRYMPHPLRDFFAFDFLRRLEQGSHSANQFAEAFHSGMKTFEGKLQTALKDLSLSRSEPELQIPVFLPLLAKKAKSGEEFWENLLKLRHDQSVMELRSVLVEADNAADRGDIAGFVKMSKEMRTVGEAVLRERGLEPRWISFSPPLSLFGVSVKGDDAGVRLPILPSLYKQFFLNRRYRAFVRNVMEEIAAVATFGNLKDRLDGYARAKPSQFGSFYVNRKEVVPSKYYQPLKDAAPPWS